MPSLVGSEMCIRDSAGLGLGGLVGRLDLGLVVGHRAGREDVVAQAQLGLVLLDELLGGLFDELFDGLGRLHLGGDDLGGDLDGGGGLDDLLDLFESLDGLDDLLDLGLRRCHGPQGLDVVAVDTLDAETQAAALGVDLDDLDLHDLAHGDDLVRALDVAVGQLADVYETLDALVDLDEGAEGDDLGDATLDDVADLVLSHDLLPRVFLGLLETEADALAVAVDVEHLDLDLLVDLQHLGRVVDVRPAELRDVDEAVDAVEVDEGAEVDDVADSALDDVAHAELVDDLLAHFLALLFEDCLLY